MLTSSPSRLGTACPVCAGRLDTGVLSVSDVPVFCNVLWDTREAAIAAPRGEIDLRFCDTCGMLRNVAFDPELVRYSPAYENSLHFSAAFRTFARELADRLTARYAPGDTDIIDVGCGKGEFLALLCNDITRNRGVGFDASFDGEAVDSSPHLRFVREYYDERHADVPARLITCRHVLEHLEDPSALLTALAERDATLYFEMPDGSYMLRERAVWDVIYEHPSYFTRPALRRLLEAHGLVVLDIGASFGGQYLYVEARRGRVRPAAPAMEDLASLAMAFGREYADTVETWSAWLATAAAAGERVALWGAGSKGVSFLNAVPGAGDIELVIDLNTRKHGRFVPGTGHMVSSPEAVRAAQPDVVLAMNRLYVSEIRATIERAGVSARVVAV